MTVATLSFAIADEAEFVSRLKRFEAEAWDQLFDTYFPPMYRYMYVHVGDRDAAEDLAGEVFEEACTGIHRFRYRGISLSNWLYKIGHNTMLDWKRRRKRCPQVALVGDVAGPDQMERLVLRDELARALSRLTREQRQVLVLRHVEGHSAASASAIMGKKENAIRALEFRALAALRRVMSTHEKEGEQA